MSPRTPQQFEQIRQDKRTLILENALILFAQKGYSLTSISMIAKQAGISKGLLYNYFDSKEELLKEIVYSEMDKMLRMFDSNNDRVLETFELKHFIEFTFENLNKNKEFWKLYFRVSLQPDVFPLLEPKIKQIAQPILETTEKYFAKKGYEDPEGEALIFGALMDGISMDYVFAPDLFPLERLKKILINRYC